MGFTSSCLKLIITKIEEAHYMPECECLESCPIANARVANMPATAEQIKSEYCLRQKFDCARYMVFTKLGRAGVPLNLFPNQIDRVKELLIRSKTSGFSRRPSLPG
jgi:hypothetical protein